jgi:cyclopropane-fatty-acyl-phospholipid synthase
MPASSNSRTLDDSPLGLATDGTVTLCDTRSPSPVATSAAVSWIDRASRAAVLQVLSGIRDGVLILHEGGVIHRFGSPTCDGLSAILHVHDPEFFRRILLGGSIGGAESYMDGQWTTDDLTAVVRLLARNASATGQLERWATWLAQPLRKVGHWLRRNTKRNSRHNIAAHYDLGNDFFELWLDPTMAYSSGIYTHADATLADAQIAKFDRLCQKLELHPGDRLLEIGCGWGGLALHAAAHYGALVTATTISRRQFELAQERVEQAGLAGRITIVEQDYRDLAAAANEPSFVPYDKLVSVEMIEAVGHDYLPTFFATCSRLLRPEGLLVLQAITIADQLYDNYRRSVDFIQRYIFPGGHLPSVSALLDAVRQSTGMRLVELENLPEHYAQTLADWQTNFLGRERELRQMGLTDEFLRMWQFYLSYCEGGFREGQIGLVHATFAQPARRPEFAWAQ